MGVTTNVVTFTIHLRMSIHLPFGECSSTKWFTTTSFGGMLTSPHLVGKTNFVGCYISGILGTMVTVDVDQNNTTWIITTFEHMI